MKRNRSSLGLTQVVQSPMKIWVNQDYQEKNEAHVEVS